MPYLSRVRFTLAAAVLVTIAALGWRGYSQENVEPTNSAPNPYRTITGWPKLPDGRKMGSTSAVDIDRDGKTVWVVERCGANSCLDRETNQIKDIPVIIHFDENGNVLKMFGAGMFVSAHGIYVDKEDNIWVTDYQDNVPAPPGGRGRRGGQGADAAGGGRASVSDIPAGPRPGATKGHQVYKFSPDGKLLMTLGKPGGAAFPDYFYEPDDVIVAPNGDIFVSEGHGLGNNQHIFKFSPDGKLIKSWGKFGTGPNEFEQPHSLAFDSKGRLYVADRNNNRIQILDQDGNYLGEMRQFSRPSGVFIDKNDTIYVADSESESVSQNHDGWKRGIRVGNLADGKVIAFIPDPVEHTRGTSAAEGVAADAQGNIYGAEVGPMDVKKYVKK
jgi:hypothetical protein